jgi:hypothetical protein
VGAGEMPLEDTEGSAAYGWLGQQKGDQSREGEMAPGAGVLGH